MAAVAAREAAAAMAVERPSDAQSRVSSSHRSGSVSVSRRDVVSALRLTGAVTGTVSGTVSAEPTSCRVTASSAFCNRCSGATWASAWACSSASCASHRSPGQASPPRAVMISPLPVRAQSLSNASRGRLRVCSPRPRGRPMRRVLGAATCPALHATCPASMASRAGRRSSPGARAAGARQLLVVEHTDARITWHTRQTWTAPVSARRRRLVPPGHVTVKRAQAHTDGLVGAVKSCGVLGTAEGARAAREGGARGSRGGACEPRNVRRGDGSAAVLVRLRSQE